MGIDLDGPADESPAGLTPHAAHCVEVDDVRAYAGKLTGLDKELSKTLDNDLQNGTLEADLSSSPVGPLGEASRCSAIVSMLQDAIATEYLHAACLSFRNVDVALQLSVSEMGNAHHFDVQAGACSRKTLVYLILTLNQCYPDYDFSLLRAHHFRKEANQQVIEPEVDSHLLEVSKVRVCPGVPVR
jgi:Maf1 regulator